MDYQMASSKKVKITASLDAELVHTIDHFLKISKIRSRSQFIEAVLRKWQEDQKMKELEARIEEYYLSLSDREREEDRQWNEIAATSAGQLWKD